MAINFSEALYAPCMVTFGRTIIVTPVVSQPGVAAYTRRGILDTGDSTIETDVGMVVVSDQNTILDIVDDDFDVPPKQGDIIDIPVDGSIRYGVGTYEVVETTSNGGGETAMTIRRIVTAVSIGQQTVAPTLLVNANTFLPFGVSAP